MPKRNNSRTNTGNKRDEPGRRKPSSKGRYSDEGSSPKKTTRKSSSKFSEETPKTRRPSAKPGFSDSYDKKTDRGSSSSKSYTRKSTREGDSDKPRSFEKPFRKKESGERSSKSYSGRSTKDGSSERSDSFKKSFRQKDSGEGSSKSYSRRSTKDGGSERSDSFKKPFRQKEERSSSKPYSKKPTRGDADKPFERSIRQKESGKRPATKKSFDEPGERKSSRSSFKIDKFSKPDRAKRSKPYSKDSDSKKERGFTKKSGGSYRSRKADDDQPASDKIRLNRFIANSGVCSRREADSLIQMGLISVNGEVITELGYKVNPGDEVRHESKVLRAEKPVYVLLNKPKGYLTTTRDPQERNTVMELIGGAVKERVYPVGRLDRNTTGLLLLTNDGDLADKLSHPSYNVKKIYKVELDKPLSKDDFQKIIEGGVRLEEGKAMVDDLAIVSSDGKTVGLELHIGWNRVVRRIFESLGYTVIKLDRSVYAGLDKKDLPRGQWRFLKKEEIIHLKHFK